MGREALGGTEVINFTKYKKSPLYDSAGGFFHRRLTTSRRVMYLVRQYEESLSLSMTTPRPEVLWMTVSLPPSFLYTIAT